MHASLHKVSIFAWTFLQSFDMPCLRNRRHDKKPTGNQGRRHHFSSNFFKYHSAVRMWKSNWVLSWILYVILNDIGLIIKDCLVLRCDEVKTYGVIGRFKASDGTPWNPDIRDAMNCQYFFNGYKIPWIWAMFHTLVYCRGRWRWNVSFTCHNGGPMY